MSTTELQRRAAGCLIGTACGDAFGMPAYFSPRQNRERYGWIDRFLPGPDDHEVHRGMPPGAVTDDTQQAMALARAILADGDVTVAGAARAICDWFVAVGGENFPWVGPSTKRAVTRLLAGEDPHQTGLWGETNGGAMRIAPVGIFAAGDPRLAVEAAARACIPTHNTSTAISGAAAVAAGMAAAMRPGATLQDLIAAGEYGAAEGARHGHQLITPSVARRIQVAVEIARGPLSLEAKLQELFDVIGAGLATTETVPCAFGCVALAEGDPVKAIIYAANLGGDADTVAAIAGGLAGALAGIEAIPADWQQTVAAANPEYDFAGTAHALAALAGRRTA